MNLHSSLRLTPSNSPFARSQTTPRSPTKQPGRPEESGLRLRKVIGTTAASSNGFDCVPATGQFAYTAGAAAVVATLRHHDLTLTQRFFRARPQLGLPPRDLGLWPLSPTPTDSRRQTFGLVKDQTSAASPLGAPARDWSDSPAGKSSTAKDRVKAATSVALSPNGKWIAVGESGYRPRVLIFSNTDQSSELPVTALAEHTFGVHALAFSPDSRYLASLGTVNDGFLFIWTIDDRTGAATLHSSNKCTAMVNAMIWIGRCLLTAGLRFAKVWRPDEDAAAAAGAAAAVTTTTTTTTTTTAPATALSPTSRSTEFNKAVVNVRHRVLAGKNCLLGDLLDANFVAATCVLDDRAVICAEAGEICSLDDTAKSQSLRVVARTDFPVAAATLERSGALRVAGAAGRSKRFDLSTLLKGGAITPTKRRKTSLPVRVGSAPTTHGMAVIDDVLVELDSGRGITLTRSESDDDDDDDHDAENHSSHQLPAHNDAVLGVQNYSCAELPTASFLTFSGNGSLRIWDAEGVSCASLDAPVETAPEMYDMPNELKAAAAIDRGRVIVVGDKYGTLTALDVTTNKIITRLRAHSAEIVDIVAFQRSGVQLLASGARDRMVQLFTWGEDRLSLLQTMDEHAGALISLMTSHEGETMISCSADRTIVVREAMLRVEDDPASVAFVMLRTITLRSSPLSMCLEASDNDILVSTMDRCIGKYNLKTGQAGFSFKCSDLEGGEATVMGKIIYAPSLNGNPTIIGVSSADKSVRLYSEYGSLVARDWGHTEGVTDVRLLDLPTTSIKETEDRPSSPKLVTVAADSTVFIWDTASPPKPSSAQTRETDEVTELPSSTAAKTLTPMAPPLRKVLSYSEISRLRTRERSTDENANAVDNENGGNESPSPSSLTQQPPPLPPSPQHRVRKKSSRISLAQAPKLEPAFRTTSDRRSAAQRRRSPSPPSPRHSNANSSNREFSRRRPSLGFSLRSKSSDNMLNAFNGTSTNGSGSSGAGFGSLASSTESLCRSLRAYRRKLASASNGNATGGNGASGGGGEAVLFPPEAHLRDLEKELKLTARALVEKTSLRSGGGGDGGGGGGRAAEKTSGGGGGGAAKTRVGSAGQAQHQLDEMAVSKLLERASERFAGLVEEKMGNGGGSGSGSGSGSASASGGSGGAVTPAEAGGDDKGNLKGA